MKILANHFARWTNLAAFAMAAIALTIFMTISPSQIYAFNEGCLCDGQYSPGKCVNGQRCLTDGESCWWWNDSTCPPCDEG
jgi:hypothetical protein